MRAPASPYRRYTCRQPVVAVHIAAISQGRSSDSREPGLRLFARPDWPGWDGGGRAFRDDGSGRSRPALRLVCAQRIDRRGRQDRQARHGPGHRSQPGPRYRTPRAGPRRVRGSHGCGHGRKRKDSCDRCSLPTIHQQGNRTCCCIRPPNGSVSHRCTATFPSSSSLGSTPAAMSTSGSPKVMRSGSSQDSSFAVAPKWSGRSP